MRDARLSPPRRRGGERGIALLVVLLTITLLTIVVVEFTQSAQVETHVALSARNALEAFYLARSGVNVGEALLVQDARMNHNDSEEDIWARPLPPLPVGDGVVALRVQDEARRLNLNALRGGFIGARRPVFARLFEVLGIDQRVLAAIVDWIDEDHEPGTDPPGAEQPYYLGLTPPVVVPSRPLQTLGELRQVRGMTPKLFARLEDFVYAAPPGSTDYLDLKVNVNTAPAEVLYALSPGLLADPGVVDRLIAARREQAFNGPSELKAVSGFAEALGGPESTGGGADFVDYKSAYFRIDAVGQVNDVTRAITAMVRREPGATRARIKRVTWEPSTADLSLTSGSPSDFLDALPPLGGGD
jgi:general secretion pathway protein K